MIGVRGGYGSAQVLPLLDADEARRACKPFIGYSDLTALLTFLTIDCGMVAFHGPMLAGPAWPRRGRIRSRFVRAGAVPREPLGELAPAGARDDPPGEAAGPLLGGTLTQLAGIARHAVRVRSARRVRAVSRRSRGASVPSRPHGHAAPADAVPARAPAPWSSASCRVATSLRRSDGAGRDDGASADFPGPCSSDFRRVIPTAGDDAAVRRRLPRDRRRPRPRL